jgi:hypothetical protein
VKAGRPKWLVIPKTVPIIFEKKDIEDFKESLPKGVSLSEGIRELVKVAVDESKKGEALIRLPILSVDRTRQTTISEYDIKLFQKPEERFNNLKNLDKIQQTKVAEDVMQLQQQIRAVRKT